MWERELRWRIAERTKELGSHALHDPPEHLLRLLGPPGALMTDRTWERVAGRTEGYRERWRVKPDELGARRPRDTAQAKHWRAVELLLPEEVHGEHLRAGPRSVTRRARTAPIITPKSGFPASPPRAKPTP